MTKDGERPVLSVTEAGQAFLKGREKLTLNRPKRSAAIITSQPGDDLPYDSELFERLRALRKSMADERNVPPFVIFHDTTLNELAFCVPHNRESFSRISGVGTAKLEQYSGPFLELITGYANANGREERAVPTQQREITVSGPRRGSTLNETKSLVAQKMPINQIAQHRGLGERTIIDHVSKLVMSGEDLDLEHLMPQPDRMATIRAAFEHTTDIRLTPVRELLGEDYSYDELALARIGLMQRGFFVRNGESFAIAEAATVAAC